MKDEDEPWQPVMDMKAALEKRTAIGSVLSGLRPQIAEGNKAAIERAKKLRRARSYNFTRFRDARVRYSKSVQGGQYVKKK